MKEHQLKCWPEFFTLLKSGEKTFEIRRNDRDFQVGDRLVENEWNPETKDYTQHMPIAFEVTHIMRGPAFGLMPHWCIMSIKPL